MDKEQQSMTWNKPANKYSSKNIKKWLGIGGYKDVLILYGNLIRGRYWKMVAGEEEGAEYL